MDVRQTQGEPRMLISRQALLHNVRLIRRRLPVSTKICAMVKADAYGHGADIVVDTLCNYELEGLACPAVNMLAVGCLDEAASLPSTTLPVLVLRTVENVYIGRQRQAIEQAIEKGWILTIGTPSAADDVARIAMNAGRRASVHVMIDTGMTRCGCDLLRLPQLLERIRSHSSLRLLSLGTHFATADVADHAFVGEQFARFLQATDPLLNRQSGKILRHAANSGAILFAPWTHLDMVRPGISLYGIDPTCRPSMDRPLRPVARWMAPIISILPAHKGSTVGYGQTWTAPYDTRIGLVPVGYADGYMRCLGNRAVMMLRGRPAPVVGRVSMDLTTIDLHDFPDAEIGDEVVVMDDDPLSPASVYELARIAGTIPYEIFTRIGPRVHRVPVEQPQTAVTSSKII